MSEWPNFVTIPRDESLLANTMFIEPRATYRIQLNPNFGFDAAAKIVPYLSQLGVTHMYCSPCLQAAAGSTHGYDIVDYQHVNEELGGATAYKRMCAALQKAGMGQILDIVPNHMAITGRENPWWWDVLENGPASRYSAYFDVDWEPPEARLLYDLLPVLADHYGKVLEAGQLKLVREGADFMFLYNDRTFPTAPRSIDNLLAKAAQLAPGSDELAFIADSLSALPISTTTDREALHRRYRDIGVLKAAIERLIHSPPLAAAVDDALVAFNTDHDRLHGMLDRQNYRLAFWRAAERDLGYRRFFDISNMIGLRMENEQVFTDTHSLVLRWLLEGVLDGVRVDHIDGLRDPFAYLARIVRAAPMHGWSWKKFSRSESVCRKRGPWLARPATTSLNRVSGLFIDPTSEARLTSFYGEFTGVSTD